MADFIDDRVTEEEFRKAFRAHEIKPAYNSRIVAVDAKSNDATIVYSEASAKDHVRLRMSSLYVDLGSDSKPLVPDESVSAEMAQQMIEDVQAELRTIEHAVWLNGRIGSAGIFK